MVAQRQHRQSDASGPAGASGPDPSSAGEAISPERQQYLRECLARADPTHGVHPFTDVDPPLARDDIAWLRSVEGPGVDLSEAQLQGAHLIGAQLQDADLERAQLQDAELFGARLQGAWLIGAQLRDARLTLAQLQSAHLRGAQLQGAYLREAQLQGAYLREAQLQGADLERAQLQGAWLSGAQLQGAWLSGAQLQGADLREAQLQSASLQGAFFDAATIWNDKTRLGDGRSSFAHIADVHWGDVNLAVLDWTLLTMPGEEQPARAPRRFDVREAAAAWTPRRSGGQKTTAWEKCRTYRRALQANRELGIALEALGFIQQAARLAARGRRLERWMVIRHAVRADAPVWRRLSVGGLRARDWLFLWLLQRAGRWFGRAAALSWSDALRWLDLDGLMDERVLLHAAAAWASRIYVGEREALAQRVEEYRTAVRANRQLAIALRAQGLNEDADRFAYRAQVLQRHLFWKQRRLLRWVFSFLLAALAGYGYRLGRIIVVYALAVTFFALLYYALGMHHSPHLALWDAFLVSITAFHGRVFSEVFRPGTPQIWVTGGEALVGLIIEGVFIAMLTQRIIGR